MGNYLFKECMIGLNNALQHVEFIANKRIEQ